MMAASEGQQSGEARKPARYFGRLELGFVYFSQDSTVQVRVGAGRGLSSHDMNGLSDPYIVAEMRSGVTGHAYGKVKSKKVLQSLNPTFSETFSFDLFPVQSADALQEDWRLHIELWDWDRFSSDDFMGSMSFHAEDIPEIAAAQQGGMDWYWLLSKDRGSVSFEPVVSVQQDTPDSLAETSATAVKLAFARLSAEERNRQEAMRELLTTERTYASEMQHALATYSLEKFKGELTDTEHHLMIGQMQDLLDLSNVFIAKLKERQDDNNITIDRIGDLMMEHLQSMEPAYTAYCQNNARVSELIAAKSKSSPHFVQVLAEGKASSKNMDIHSFRLLPLQRLTRYPLLLQEIDKRTTTEHVDKVMIERVRQHASVLVARVNECVRGAELRQELERISQITYPRPEFEGVKMMAKGVSLLKTGLFYNIKLSKFRKGKGGVPRKASTKLPPTPNRRLSLMLDAITGHFLLLSKVISSTEEVLVYPRIPLDMATLLAHEDIMGLSATTEIALELETPFAWEAEEANIVVLRTDTATQREEWVQALLQANRIHNEQVHVSEQEIAHVVDFSRRLVSRGRELDETESKFIQAAKLVQRLIKLNRERESAHEAMLERQREQQVAMVAAVRSQEQARAKSNWQHLLSNISGMDGKLPRTPSLTSQTSGGSGGDHRQRGARGSFHRRPSQTSADGDARAVPQPKSPTLANVVDMVMVNGGREPPSPSHLDSAPLPRRSSGRTTRIDSSSVATTTIPEGAEMHGRRGGFGSPSSSPTASTSPSTSTPTTIGGYRRVTNISSSTKATTTTTTAAAAAPPTTAGHTQPVLASAAAAWAAHNGRSGGRVGWANNSKTAPAAKASTVAATPRGRSQGALVVGTPINDAWASISDLDRWAASEHRAAPATVQGPSAVRRAGSARARFLRSASSPVGGSDGDMIWAAPKTAPRAAAGAAAAVGASVSFNRGLSLDSATSHHSSSSGGSGGAGGSGYRYVRSNGRHGGGGGSLHGVREVGSPGDGPPSGGGNVRRSNSDRMMTHRAQQARETELLNRKLEREQRSSSDRHINEKLGQGIVVNGYGQPVYYHRSGSGGSTASSAGNRSALRSPGSQSSISNLSSSVDIPRTVSFSEPMVVVGNNESKPLPRRDGGGGGGGWRNEAALPTSAHRRTPAADRTAYPPAQSTSVSALRSATRSGRRSGSGHSSFDTFDTSDPDPSHHHQHHSGRANAVWELSFEGMQQLPTSTTI